MCALYGKPTVTDVNSLRYQLFCLHSGNTEQLPPCRDALVQHMKRAVYQSAIWRRALEARPIVPSPDGHGWTVEGEELRVHWMEQCPAPDALLELVSCGCSSGCSTRRCSCKSNGMLCTDICQCDKCACENQYGEGEGSDEEMGVDFCNSDDNGDDQWR